MARKPKAEEYQYVLDWIEESIQARRAQNTYVERTVMAYQGDPSQNYYKKSVRNYADHIAKTDSVRGKELQAMADEIPERRNMTVHNAVETVVSMAQGGVGRYEFGPYDPELDKDDRVVDMLSSAAKHFYNTEKIDAVMPQFIRAAVLSGASYFHLKQKNKKKVLTMLDSSQVLTDPKRVKTNVERFIGFSQRESWRSVKDRTKKLPSGYILKSLNETDVYLSQILLELNSTLGANPTEGFLHEQLRRDIDIFYKPIVTRIQDYRKQNPDYMYDGDEVEIIYLYDLVNDKEFQVVNRKYIIVGQKNKLQRDVKCDFIDYKGKVVKKTKTIKLDHPMIELPYIKTFWDTYPVSPLFYVLDDFDSLCAMESVLYHNLSIMSPLSFIGQSSDAEKVSRLASVAGEIIEGLPQTFAVMDKTHDVSPTLAAITRYEERIKRIIGATDPFEMQAMLGDRASAKEVTAMSGQISQRLNPFIANIEAAMATLGDKVMKLHLIMNDEPYSFVHNGKYAELKPEDMAGDYEVQAKLSSSIKLEQEMHSRKALELIQYLGQTDKIDDIEFFGTLLPIVLAGSVTREQASKMIAEKYRPMDEEVIASIKAKAEADAKRDPIDKIDLSAYSAEELDDMIRQMSAVTANPNTEMDGSQDQQVMLDQNGNIVPVGDQQPNPANPSAQPVTEPVVDPTAPPEQPTPTDQQAGASVTINGQPITPSGPSNPDTAGEVYNDPTGQM